MKKISNKERFYPLKKLAKIWLNDFGQNRESYINTIFPMIISGNFSKFTKSEIKILNEIKSNLKKSEWKNFRPLFLGAYNRVKKEVKNEEILKTARNFILNSDFLSFEKLYSNNPLLLKNIHKEYETTLKNRTKSLKETIVKLACINYKEALSYFYKEAKKLPEKEKQETGFFLEDIEDLIDTLKNFDFMGADNLFYKKKVISKDEYENLKKDYVLKYFKGENIDDKKALAISSLRPNVLVKARAGSGKTSTLCLKTLLLIEKYNINPDEILILAFNKDARAKIEKDLLEKYGLKNYLTLQNSTGFENAKTFHGFAKSIMGDIQIADDKKRKVLLTKAIENVLEKDDFKKDFYNFYKTALDIKVKKEYSAGEYLNIKFVKDLSQTTLKGEIVKSHGEKYIADFLFENGIEYEYEKSIIFTKEEKHALNIDDDWNIYRPDFYIKFKNKEFYLEHWGVDENALDPSYFGKTGPIKDVSRYIRNIHIKRRYFKKKNIPLIETWAKNSQIRENFEITLHKTFKKFKIMPVKQDETVLFDRVKKLNIKAFYKTIENFISSVKKSRTDNLSLEQKFDNQNLSERTKIFLKLGQKVFLEYQKLLGELNLYDFDDLIIKASDKILKAKGEVWFQISSDKKLKVKSLKYILIDEYQDFSKLFFNLILAIKCYNPALKILAAGDDWQAINGFAGSDLYYFKNFEKLFNNSKTYDLTYNYRSDRKIIDVSNTLMSFEGVPSVPVKSAPGEVFKIFADKTFINKDNPSDLAYTFKKDYANIKAKYLKTIHRIIRLNPDKTFLILSRLNNVASASLMREFAPKLLSMKTVDESKIEFMTIHKSKGLEADIVIVLRAINGVMPFLHPDYEIACALNRSYKDITDEEKRLFYVALTRAKEKLFILTESKLETAYLKALNLPKIDFRDLNFEDEPFA